MKLFYKWAVFVFLMHSPAIQSLSQTISFSGHFTHHQPAEKVVFRFSPDPLFGVRGEHRFELDSTGHFIFQYPARSALEVSVQIGDNVCHLVAFPNTAVRITADLSRFASSVHVAGEKQQLYPYLPLIFSLAHSAIDTGYASTLIATVDSLYKKKGITRSEKEYAIVRLRYTLLNTRVNKAFSHSRIGDTSFDFLNQLNTQDATAAAVSNEYNELVELALLHRYIKTTGQSFDKVVQEKDFFVKRFGDWMLLSGQVRNAFLTRFMYRIFNKGTDKSTVDSLYRIYQAQCTSPTMRSQLQEQYEQYVNIQRGQHHYQLSKTADRWSEFSKKYIGHVTIFECWASWCQPCILVAPRLQQLLKEFPGKQIDLVYVAVRDKESSWAHAIKKYAIEAKHVFLEADAYAEWQSAINISSIPYTIVQDQKGNCIFKGYFSLNEQLLREKIQQALEDN